MTMHTTIYRDDIVPVCGRCEGDGVQFHHNGGVGAWSSCPACSGTGVEQPPRRRWRDEVAGTLGCLGFVAIAWAALVMLP